MVSPAPAKPAAKPAAERPAAEKPAPAPDAKQSFESAFLDYLRMVHRTYADAQKRSADTYQAYQREASDTYSELQKRADDLQRDYVASLQEAFGRDDAGERTEKAYHDATANYRRLVDDAQRQAEQMNKKLVALLKQQGEDVQKQFAEALTSYLRALQGAMQQMGGAGVRLSDLEYLSQSIGTVALYAGATGALSR
jgi:uncharacterized protein YukE